MIDARDVLADLDSYAAADERERESLEKIRKLLRKARDPFARGQTRHVTGSAVVARPSGEPFLLVHHRRLDRWLQPGGHVEAADASVFDTARREASEETGLTRLAAPLGPRVLDLDVHRIPARPGRPAHVHHDLRYLLTTRQRELSAALEEVHRAAWFSLEEALAAGVDHSLARALAKARARLVGRASTAPG